MNIDDIIKYKNLTSNYYVNIFYNHREFEKHIRDEYNLSKLDIITSIPRFKKRSIVITKDLEFSKKILSDYYIISEQYEAYNSIDKMRDYIEFLRFVEKTEMFENAPDNKFNICSEKDDEFDALYIALSGYKISIKFENTILPDDFEQSILDKAIYGENHVQLVTLNITRESGKKMSNTFKFVYGDNPDINDVSDELLLNKVFEDVNTKMTDIFDILMNSDTSDWRNLYNYGFKIQ